MNRKAPSAAEQKSLVERFRALSRPLEPEATGVPPRLPKLAGLRAVLFDVYGTLVVSASGDVGTDAGGGPQLGEALRECGLQASEETAKRGAALLKQAIARAHEVAHHAGVDHPEVDIQAMWQDVLRSLAAEGSMPGADDPVLVRRLAVEFEARANPSWPMPGAAETLAGLRERGLVLGVVSNAQFYTPLLLEALFSRTTAQLGFPAGLCAWSYRHLRAKPSTALLEAALMRLRDEQKILPEAVLAVGNDMAKDVMPAARLGCRTALFAGDRRSLRVGPEDPGLQHTPPDAVLTALPQLLELVAGE
ncbi:MAG: HAD family hydrolase [Planctomycetes bacterium]|nr:HAD family hydrolase [Planctomycetota bacterium]